MIPSYNNKTEKPLTNHCFFSIIGHWTPDMHCIFLWVTWSNISNPLIWFLSSLSERQLIYSLWLWPLFKPLSHSTAIPRRWHGDLKFLRAPWDRTKILKHIANNFTFSITWRCHGAPTATVAFPRSAHGVPPRSRGVLTGDRLRSHGALTACSWRAKSCHCASTACTQRARRAQCVSTASSRSVYEHMRKQVLQAYCRNRHSY